MFRVPLVSGLDPNRCRAAFDQRRLDIYAAMPAGKRGSANAISRGPVPSSSAAKVAA